MCAHVSLNTSLLYLHGKSSCLVFEAWSISVLRKHTEERAAGCVCVCERKGEGREKQTLVKR